MNIKSHWSFGESAFPAAILPNLWSWINHFAYDNYAKLVIN